ncbi:hypothetical protein C5167_006467 [Papaver somniferum]|uniref:Uncharacterized protein n=1 Tax=Papaver somniferum TaxID=3469 RepID=A0A4Y7JGK3_PAPSO|nr:hypothetical protein C5167_006467 [Papaver somniferum]
MPWGVINVTCCIKKEAQIKLPISEPEESMTSLGSRPMMPDINGFIITDPSHKVDGRPFSKLGLIETKVPAKL